MIDSRSRFATALAAVTLATTSGCMMGPHDGQITGSAYGTALSFNGVYDSPNIPINLQVLDHPDSAPVWKTFATALTSTTPSHYPSSDPNPYYQWGITATPAGNDPIGQERWPSGGLVRIRAVADDPQGHGSFFVLDVSDEDADSCFGAHPNDNWAALVLDCGKDPSYGAAVADDSVTPADVFAGHPASAIPKFLTRKQYALPSNQTQDQNAFAYYAKVGMPSTLHDFQVKFGFLDGTGSPVAASYYNYGDLGIGRRMNCAVKNGTTACYVSNLAPTDGSGHIVFGDENDSLNLVTNPAATPFATVAMTFTPPITAADSVKFVVYDPAGNWQGHAQLDSLGANQEVPGNCLSCHGGSATFNASTLSVSAGAHLLPFDVFNSLHFSGASGYTLGAQSEAMRLLNVMVMNAGATPAISAFVKGLYKGTPTVANTAADPSWAPAEWSDTPAHAKLYSSVVAPYCRTCHMSNAITSTNSATALDFSTFNGFGGFAALINADVCATGGHVMPHAEQTLRNFWDSPARAHLTGTLGLYTSCNPL
jgi:hypothetical protein